MALYRHLRTREQIDAEYNPAIDLSALKQTMAEYQAASEQLRADLTCRLGLQFGPTVSETLDIVEGPGQQCPVVIFLHGGYWHSGQASDFSFVARGFHDAGCVTVVPNYDLCPDVTLDEITRQNRAALAWVFRNIELHGGNPDQIYLCGHSAGAQQVAMLASTHWHQRYDLPINVVKGGLAISGIFDLRPLAHSFLQPIIGLNEDVILRQSPTEHVPSWPAPPLAFVVGKRETAEFHRQSEHFANQWAAAGHKVQHVPDSKHDHFSILDELRNSETAIIQALLSLSPGF